MAWPGMKQVPLLQRLTQEATAPTLHTLTDRLANPVSACACPFTGPADTCSLKSMSLRGEAKRGQHLHSTPEHYPSHKRGNCMEQLSLPYPVRPKHAPFQCHPRMSWEVRMALSPALHMRVPLHVPPVLRKRHELSPQACVQALSGHPDPSLQA